MLALSGATYDAAWIAGLVIALGYFLVFEVWALLDGHPERDTLSGHVWRWIGTRRGWSGWRIPARLGVLLFLAWLTEHFVFGLF